MKKQQQQEQEQQEQEQEQKRQVLEQAAATMIAHMLGVERAQLPVVLKERRGPRKRRAPRGKLPEGMTKRRYPNGTTMFVYRERRNGQDIRRSLGSDYQEALRQYHRLEAGGIAPRITVAAAADRWLRTRIATGRNTKGRKLAAHRARTYLLRYFAGRRLSSVTPDDLRAYRLWLERYPAKLAPLTVTWILADARSLCRWAVENGFIDRSPFPSRLMPKVQQQPPDRLTPDEEAKVRAIPEPWAFTIRFLLGTGLRWAEACRASRGDLEGNLLIVHHTKSGKVRRIPLDHDPALLAELRARVGRFCQYAEGSPGSFANIVRRHSGVQQFHVHMTRHTFACSWLARGGSLPALQQLLGHSSVTTTQRYASLFTEHLVAEARRLADAGS
jgi:integrase